MKLNILRAFNGDAIHIQFSEGTLTRNILIDGGMPNTYVSLKGKKGKEVKGALNCLVEELKNNGQKIDLLILTHVDDDHIGGILRWFEKDVKALELIVEVWFNSGRLIYLHFEAEENKENDISLGKGTDPSTSIGQGATFEDFIESRSGLWRKELIKNDQPEFNLGPAIFKILSPDDEKLKLLLNKWKKEDLLSVETSGVKSDYHLSIREHLEDTAPVKDDQAIHNGSSISFLFELNEVKCLFLADAHPSTIVRALNKLGFNDKNKLKVDLVKLSHHGSVYNNSTELFEIIDCDSFIVSTNGDRHAHPHKKLLARLIQSNEDCKIYFNYPEQISRIFSERDFKDFPKAQFFGTEKLKEVLE